MQASAVLINFDRYPLNISYQPPECLFDDLSAELSKFDIRISQHLRGLHYWYVIAKSVLEEHGVLEIFGRKYKYIFQLSTNVSLYASSMISVICVNIKNKIKGQNDYC